MKDSDSTIGKKLSDMFYEKWKDKASIEQLQRSFSIKAPELSILMSLFWLYYLAFSRAAHPTQGKKMSRRQYESISDHLATNAVERCRSLLGVRENAAYLLGLYGHIFQRLYACYNEHIDSSPSVHWYIGKEMTIILNGDDAPNPALILYFGELLSDESVRIKQYLDSL